MPIQTLLRHTLPWLAALMGTVAVAQSTLPKVDAEVRKVDLQTRKITLQHGDIPNLDMPAMSMVFQVEDAALLERVKAGDRVRFTADKVRGTYTVMSLEPAP